VLYNGLHNRERNVPTAQSMLQLDDERITVRDTFPLLMMHLACLGVFAVGWSKAAVVACLVTYLVRVFALTAGFHRYFSHKAFKTSRVFQFVLAFLGASAAQLGPLWWASHHRWHHLTADTDKDIHSPVYRGFFWAHLGWLLCRRYARTELDRVQDFAKFPELRWLDRHTYAAPVALALMLFGLGAWMGKAFPSSGTSAWQMVIWGFFISTVLVYHATFSINSFMHMFGTRRYNTPDHSRNNVLLALLTMGEGWHNNHHRYSISARQGFFWWELDLSYGVLKTLSWLHIVWDLRPPPAEVYAEARGSVSAGGYP
jgi:stearoyl-CoA desaturase (Delta-9 desaturase)